VLCLRARYMNVRRLLPTIHLSRASIARANRGSFARAAETLLLTAGAVSKQVGELERCVSLSLFEREREQRLAKRLALHDANELPRSVRIGGVLGASMHFPELDITAAPRLALTVGADARHSCELPLRRKPNTMPAAFWWMPPVAFGVGLLNGVGVAVTS
jgi:Bacterial regulatory helix-turn-helix protein, lysR family